MENYISSSQQSGKDIRTQTKNMFAQKTKFQILAENFSSFNLTYHV